VSKEIEKELYDSTPSMFRNKPFFFILYVIAVVVGGIDLIDVTFDLGLFSSPEENKWSILSVMLLSLGVIGFVILVIWRVRVINTRLTITNERVRFRTGIFSKKIREIFLSDIRSVEINQRFMQRIFSTGRIEISSAATSEAEIAIDGLPNPYGVKNFIDEYRREHQD
jgi:uncharacterized membrane protein YdbT with pleckstrin-like domain